MSALQGDERDYCLARLGVVAAGHGCLGHRRVADKRAFDLDGGNPVSGNVHDVVDPAEEPEIAVFVDSRAVPDEIGVLPAIPVGLLEALRIPVDAAKHRRPRLANDEVATASWRNLL